MNPTTKTPLTTKTPPTTKTPTTQTMMKTSPNAQKTAHGDKYGWFSSKSKAVGNTTHIYLDKSGVQVEVTCVSRTSNHGSGWDDIVSVGQVCQWVKSIKNNYNKEKRTI